MVEISRKYKKKSVWNFEGKINDIWKKIVTCVKNTVKWVVAETCSITFFKCS